MAELDCRILAMLALALSLLSLSGVIFVRHHHHNAYYHTPEAFVTERECRHCDSPTTTDITTIATPTSDSDTTDDDGQEFRLENSSPTNIIATARYESNETSSDDAGRAAFDVSEACLQCICEAGTECKPAKCGNGLECGIFRISRPYWIDAGCPTVEGGSYEEEAGVNSERAYLQCVNNPFCAARAVKRYIGRYIRDCDNNEIIDCYDYAEIHLQGPTGCKLIELNAMIFGRLYRCINKLTVKRIGEHS